MTTIAVRDGVMASDSRCERYAVVGTYQKLFRRPYGIVGYAGNIQDTEALLRWYDAGASIDKPLPRFVIYKDEEPSCTLLILENSGAIKFVSRYLHVETLEDEFFAIGSGSEIAMGAMAHGASAEEAIEIAIRLNPGTGGPIRVERL